MVKYRLVPFLPFAAVKLSLPPPRPGWPSDAFDGDDISFFAKVSTGSVTAANATLFLCRASPSSSSSAAPIPAPAPASFFGRASLRTDNVVGGGGGGGGARDGEEIEVFQYSFSEDDIKGVPGDKPRRWVEAAVEIE